MANWCWNCVSFTGEEQNLKSFTKLMDKTIQQEEKTKLGQLLFGLEGELDGYMFQIVWANEGDSITFESRWSPIPQEMVRIAQLFDLEFTYEYEESGSSLYGQYTYENGHLYDQQLSDDEIDSCRIKDEEDDPDDPDELNGFDHEKCWDLVNQTDMELIDIHSSLKQPENEENLCN